MSGEYEVGDTPLTDMTTRASTVPKKKFDTNLQQRLLAVENSFPLSDLCSLVKVGFQIQRK